MKNAILFPGAGESAKSFWLPFARRGLEERRYTVWIPVIPSIVHPNIYASLPYILNKGVFTKNTVLIAHSAGCPLALAVLQHIRVKIKRAILVAGFWRELPPPGTNKALLQRYDFPKIRDHAEDIIFINSDNDPWGCDDNQGKEMFDRIGGTLILRHGEGHMGSDTYKQPYKHFPLILNLVDNIFWDSQ